MDLSIDGKDLDPSITLESCKCPQEMGSIDFNSATSCRIIKVPVKISNLCPGKEFIIFITVYDVSTGEVIGQICKTFTGSNRNCQTTHTEYITLAIKKPLCSNDRIVVNVGGNYVNVCDVK